jgi:Asp-tRNA(Asn)/Glu-tRNA(Gln) amidotransferase A subunit family amidase
MTIELPNTILQLRALIDGGALSVAGAVEAQCERFLRLNQWTHAAVAVFDVDRPVGQMRHLELGAVGLAHKDIFELTNRQPGLGRDLGTASLGSRDAVLIDTLSRAGALNLGALALAEDACAAIGQTRSLPSALNPLGGHLAVGGSSSGSAVAVASGMVYASLGTDTAGSVRIPAMTCGVMGLKTTHGLLDRHGMVPLAASLDSVGVIARSVQDIECVVRALAPGVSRSVSDGLKVGYWVDEVHWDGAIERYVLPVMQQFARERVNLSTAVQRGSVLQQVMTAYEIAHTHREGIVQGQACEQVMDIGRLGLSISPAWYRLTLSQRALELRDCVDHLFGALDVIVCPLQVQTLPTCQEVYVGGSEFDPHKLLALHRYTGWINYLGLPALAMPIARDAAGLAVSVQLVAKPFEEGKLLAFGRHLQNELIGSDGVLPVLNLV